MISFSLDVDVSLSGLAKGTAANSQQRSSVSRHLPASFTSAGSGATLCSNVIDKATVVQTLAAGGAVAIDLTSFTVNPFSESAQSFAAVRVIYVEHATGSAASSISVFNAAAGNSFQGPLSAAGTLTFAAGGNAVLRASTATGWVVDGTHKNFYIVNNDGVNAASIRYFIAGS